MHGAPTASYLLQPKVAYYYIFVQYVYGLPAGRPSRSQKIEKFENCNFTFLNVKMSMRDECGLQNCTDTHFWGTSSSKKLSIFGKMIFWGCHARSRSVTLGHLGWPLGPKNEPKNCVFLNTPNILFGQ